MYVPAIQLDLCWGMRKLVEPADVMRLFMSRLRGLYRLPWYRTWLVLAAASGGACPCPKPRANEPAKKLKKEKVCRKAICNSIKWGSQHTKEVVQVCRQWTTLSKMLWRGLLARMRCLKEKKDQLLNGPKWIVKALEKGSPRRLRVSMMRRWRASSRSTQRRSMETLRCGGLVWIGKCTASRARRILRPVSPNTNSRTLRSTFRGRQRMESCPNMSSLLGRQRSAQSLKQWRQSSKLKTCRRRGERYCESTERTVSSIALLPGSLLAICEATFLKFIGILCELRCSTPPGLDHKDWKVVFCIRELLDPFFASSSC